MNPNRLPETHGNAVTSWIPLVSGWPANSECADVRWNYWGDIIAAWDPGYGVSADPTLVCHPKGVTTWWLQERLGPNEATTVSLGPMDCPENYYTATQNVQVSSSTLIACCPSGFEYSGRIESQGDTGQCFSRVEAGQDLTYMGRGEDGAWTARTTRINTATSVAGVQINGWKFADETAASTPSAESCSLLQSFETTPTNSCSQSEAFGNSAKIGIGVGISLGLTGLVALGAGLLMMYRARKAARSMSPPPSITKDFNDGSGQISSSQFSLSHTPELRERHNPTEMPDSATQPSSQNWTGYPVNRFPTEQPLYHSYAELWGRCPQVYEGQITYGTCEPQVGADDAGYGILREGSDARLVDLEGSEPAPPVSIIQDREAPSHMFPLATLEDAVRVDLEVDGPLDSRCVKDDGDDNQNILPYLPIPYILCVSCAVGLQNEEGASHC
ncbi:hypothetical protein DL764_009315 [Monosporascus ibericus]|uniref:Uncharacterized protein n=1 Tax=Monosporascus ibericus TaxID=155417 RepID=A0A4Q4SY33_9PEZI|nr:hypothetical protein DL764_009315 [Monosporascus ibericus]